MFKVLQLSELPISWWRHPMKTFSALLALFEGNSPVDKSNVLISLHISITLFTVCSLCFISWRHSVSCRLWRGEAGVHPVLGSRAGCRWAGSGLQRSGGSLNSCGPFYLHGLTLIPAWISNHMPSEVWDEISYPFLNFNGATVEV